LQNVNLDNELIWTGIRSNFYEDDSLNNARKNLFLPTIYFDFQYTNMSSDTIKLIVNDDNCSLYIELSDKSNRYCLTGFSVADTIKIYAKVAKSFPYSIPIFKEDNITPFAVANEIINKGEIFYITDTSKYKLSKSSEFRAEFRQPNDLSIE
jgi:hypothetical protein